MLPFDQSLGFVYVSMTDSLEASFFYTLLSFMSRTAPVIGRCFQDYFCVTENLFSVNLKCLCLTSVLLWEICFTFSSLACAA